MLYSTALLSYSTALILPTAVIIAPVKLLLLNNGATVVGNFQYEPEIHRVLLTRVHNHATRSSDRHRPS